MGVYKYIILGILVFILGWFSADMYKIISNLNVEKPLSVSGYEFSSPGDWVKESQIKIYSDYVLIKIKNATWGSFADTNSMDPLLDANANSIELKPQSEKELKVGDIIAYKADFVDGVIIHRIVKIDSDEKGWYVVVKGDNNPHPDPQKVRFDQIKGVLVGVIY